LSLWTRPNDWPEECGYCGMPLPAGWPRAFYPTTDAGEPLCNWVCYAKMRARLVEDERRPEPPEARCRNCDTVAGISAMMREGDGWLCPDCVLEREQRCQRVDVDQLAPAIGKPWRRIRRWGVDDC
jgi:hypothetical protein